MLVHNPVARAGFDFALQSLTRSARHRIPLATTVGTAVAAAATMLHAAGSGDTMSAEASPAALATQTLVLVVLVSGLRQCTRIRVSVNANATFILAGMADARPFRTGASGRGCSHSGARRWRCSFRSTR